LASALVPETRGWYGPKDWIPRRVSGMPWLTRYS